MILRNLLNTSITLSLLRYFDRWYDCLEQRLSRIYHNSQAHRGLNKFWEKTKFCFRYSLLGRITEIKQVSLGVLDNSRVLQYLVNFYNRCKHKIICYLRPSFTLRLAKDTKAELIFSPARIVSAIMATSILVNAALSIVLHRQIGLWGWLMRALFLFTGASGFFCQADWLTIKQTSVFLRKAKIN